MPGLRLRIAFIATAALSASLAVSAAEDPAALRGQFDAAVAAGKDADAQAAGKELLAEVPEDPTCVHVLRTFLAKRWKWPRLTTSFAALRRWEQDVVDTAKEPDLRLALIDAIE